jgi:hypothetical protein
MPDVELRERRIYFGDRFSVGFQRTLRIPDDGRTYPLPPGLGPFPIHRVEEYAGRLPPGWRERGGFFIALYRREALWLAFSGARWKPNAVKVGIGEINAITGDDWDQELHAVPQDYLVCPPQPWLDGIHTGSASIRQFVAAPLGAGKTVEGRLTGAERSGGIQFAVFEPKQGVFPDAPPPDTGRGPFPQMAPAMGIAAGGQVRQKIYPDEFGIDTWDASRSLSTVVHILNADQYAAVTGLPMPATPIDVHTYIERGFPWFELYDEDAGDLPVSPRLSRVEPLEEP